MTRCRVLLGHQEFDAWQTGKAEVDLLRSAQNDLLRIWPVSKRVNVSGRGDDDPSLVEPVEDGAVYEGSPLGPNELFPQDHPDTIASIPRQGHLGSVQLAQSASSFGAISSQVFCEIFLSRQIRFVVLRLAVHVAMARELVSRAYHP
jgi:hypothetical protein